MFFIPCRETRDDHFFRAYLIIILACKCKISSISLSIAKILRTIAW